MGIEVTDLRAIFNEADDATGWNLGAATTTSFAEGTSSIAAGIGESTDSIYYTTGTSIDMSSTLIYVYSSGVYTRDGWENGVHGLLLGDGTDRISFNQSGNDKAAFHHSDGPVDWQCFVIDTAIAPSLSSSTEHQVVDGSFASLAYSAITDIGSHYITLSKALGGGVNCYNDIIRYGNDGLRITSGTTGERGTFLDIVLEDRDTGDLKGHGMIRELTTGVYGIQGPITFGYSGDTLTSYFEDNNVSLIFEDRNIDDDKYYFKIEGQKTATNSFILTNVAVSSAGPGVVVDFTSDDIDEINLNGGSFSQLDNSITFSSIGEPNHKLTNYTINACGSLEVGKMSALTSVLITNTTEISGAGNTGSLFVDTGFTIDNMHNITFSNYTNKFALYFTQDVSGTISLDNFQFDHSGVDIYWAGQGIDGTLTINLTNGTNASSTETDGGTITLVSTTDFTLTNLEADTEVRIYLSGTSEDYISFGAELYGQESITGSTTYQYGADVVSSGHNCIVMLHNIQYETLRFTVDLLGTDTSIPIQQQYDRNYQNQ